MPFIEAACPVITLTDLKADTREPHLVEYADETLKQHTADTHSPISLSNRDREDLAKIRELKPYHKTKNIASIRSHKKSIGVRLVKLHVEIGIMLRESLLLNLHYLLKVRWLKTPDNDHKALFIHTDRYKPLFVWSLSELPLKVEVLFYDLQ